MRQRYMQYLCIYFFCDTNVAEDNWWKMERNEVSNGVFVDCLGVGTCQLYREKRFIGSFSSSDPINIQVLQVLVLVPAHCN